MHPKHPIQNSPSAPELDNSIDDLIGSVIDASLDAVIMADEHSRIIRINPAAVAIFGHEASAIVGRTIGDVIVPAHLRAAHERGFAHHVEHGGRRMLGKRVELEALHARGHSFPIEIQIEEITRNGRRIFAAFVRDLSQRRAMEAEMAQQREQLHQSEKLAAMTTLLAGVAHELNNPLAIVIGRAVILQDALAGTDEEKTLRKLQDAADRCRRIVKTFLAVAQQGKPKRIEVELNQLLEGALEFSAFDLRQRRIAIGKFLDPNIGTINGDHDQLAQVFVGLILNAKRALSNYALPRKMTIRTSKSAGFATVRVEDNGPGLDPSLLTRVFEPFFTTKAFGEGGGMGLSIARGIIEAHGGTIGFDTSVKEGCAVVVTMPLDKGERI